MYHFLNEQQQSDGIG